MANSLIRLILLLGAISLVGNAAAGTVLDFWHSYTPPQSGQRHCSFHIANYKRGLFFGSCGPSTKSLQWAFTVDLAGEGPVYAKDQISLSDDNAKSLKIVSGQITIDENKTLATIDLTIEQFGTTNMFVANGKHSIKKLK